MPSPPFSIQLVPVPVHATKFLSRLLGIFSPTARRRGSVVLYPCSSVHTFFLKAPLDIVFLDAERKVLEVYDSVAPFRVISYSGSYYVVEGRAGSLSSKLEVGDVVDF